MVKAYGFAGGTIPSEDAFTGLAVSLASDAPVRFVSMVKNGLSTQMRPPLVELAPSTVVAHIPTSNTEKNTTADETPGASAPARMHRMQRYADAKHCAPSTYAFSCAVAGSLCNGAPFRGCQMQLDTFERAGCSTEVELQGDIWEQRHNSSSCTAAALRSGDTGTRIGEADSKRYRGTCGATTLEASDCMYGQRGAWRISHATRGLEVCVALCRCCARCRYVSFSAKFQDCSWFNDEKCNPDERLIRSGKLRRSDGAVASSYVTVRV